MFKKKIKLSDDLYAKLEKAAAMLHAADPEELATQILESELDKILRGAQSKDMSDSEVKDIENQLKGLGYLE